MVGRLRDEGATAKGDTGADNYKNQGDRHDAAGSIGGSQLANVPKSNTNKERYPQPPDDLGPKAPAIAPEKTRGVILLSRRLERKDRVRPEAVRAELRQQLGKDVRLTLEYAESGSIRISFDADPGDLAQLKKMVALGELTEILGCPIEGVRSLEEDCRTQHLEILRDGVKTWNAWRQRNPAIEPNLSKTDLKCANLNGADLSEVDFFSADLFRANLSGANLFRANLNGADLGGAYLINADLFSADLSEANLKRAFVLSAELKKAYLLGADLGEADFSRANLNGAYLSGAYLFGANLFSANLSETYLNGANLSGANLNGADLSGAYLNGASLEKASVLGATFGDNEGISEEIKADLIYRGALF